MAKCLYRHNKLLPQCVCCECWHMLQRVETSRQIIGAGSCFNLLCTRTSGNERVCKSKLNWTHTHNFIIAYLCVVVARPLMCRCSVYNISWSSTNSEKEAREEGKYKPMVSTWYKKQFVFFCCIFLKYVNIWHTFFMQANCRI